jgi:WD40 repeat protein
MQHIAELDMNASIQPRRLSVGSMSKRRYGFVLDSRDFSQMTEKAVQNGPSNGVDHALEHLIEVANRSPEICVVLDGLGHMSAWGLENAGCKNRKPTTVFNVAHVDGVNIAFGTTKNLEEDYAQICVFAGRLSDSNLTILAHTFDGKIDWYDSKITEMFDPFSRKDRARLISSWTGHDANVNKVVQNYNRCTVFTLDEDGAAILWDYDKNRLLRKSGFDSKEEVIQVILAADGKHVACLHPESISVWNTQATTASMIGRVKHQSRDLPLCLVKVGSVPDIHLSSIDTSGKIETWRLNLRTAKDDPRNGTNGNQSLLSKVTSSNLDLTADMMHICLIEGRPHDNKVALAATRTGLVQILACDLTSDASVLEWSPVRTFETSVEKPMMIRAVSSGKVVLIDEAETGLSIWDMNHGWLEYEHQFKGSDTVERMAWTTTQSGQSLLAVGLQFRIVILAQLHFNTLDEQDPWVQVRQFRLRDFATHSIGDLCWLQDGSLLAGTANQLFVHEVDIELDGRLEKHIGSLEYSKKMLDMIQVVTQINASLAIFHPAYLHHLISLGRHNIAHRILSLLHKMLRYWSEGEDLPNDLGIKPVDAIVLDSSGQDTNDNDDIVDEDKAAALSEYLANSDLPQLSASNRGQLGHLAKHLAALRQYQSSVDENALRYLHLSNILSPADDGRGPDRSPASYREIVFASRSSSQDILVDHLTRLANGKLTWADARKSGLFMWLADPEAVRQQMEVIARNEYTNSDDRSPVECAVYYLALRKKNVLQGLWRMAPGLREQKNTLKLLANNFEEARWKTTALKNAYVLLSKRRFMYAAAFFLLGGSLKDAVNVCVHQLKDMQLAVAVARVYEGDDSPVLKSLLVEQILPDAVQRGDRWCASWAFAMLGMREKAFQSLVKAPQVLLEGVTTVDDAKILSMQTKHWRNYDPTLAILYRQLRAELAKGKASHMAGVTEKEEWDFVLRCAAQYTRMGCDWLALDLVRNWKFLPRQQREVAEPEATSDEVRNEAKQEGREATVVLSARKKPPPTQFQEPSASSLLDSFGF